MKHIHETVQALESDIGFWPPSWILLKLKNAKKNLQGKFPRAYWKYLEIIWAGVYGYITKFWW